MDLLKINISCLRGGGKSDRVQVMKVDSQLTWMGGVPAHSHQHFQQGIRDRIFEAVVQG